MIEFRYRPLAHTQQCWVCDIFTDAGEERRLWIMITYKDRVYGEYIKPDSDRSIVRRHYPLPAVEAARIEVRSVPARDYGNPVFDTVAEAEEYVIQRLVERHLS